MWLTEIEADRFRNLKAVSLSLPAGLTVVAGRNGQGKTSLLEAVYLLGTGRSFRTRRFDDLMGWAGGPTRVAGKVTGLRGNSKLTVVMDDGSRKMLLDGVEKELEDFIGRLDVVDLNAERMKVLRGAPEERRRFLDRGIVGLDPSYLRSLGEYRRVLQQRNALLRAGPGRSRQDPQLDVWDERLVSAAHQLHFRRREYAMRLGSRLGELSRIFFAESGLELTMHYRPSPSATGAVSASDFRQSYADALAAGRGRDRVVRHTCRGPHRDELLVELDGVDLRRFGSAGQVRAAMIALKLGKLSLLGEDRGEAPVFLMDDFDSDLDEVRASALAGFLKQGGFQALVATSKEQMADRLGVSFMKVLIDNGVAHAA